ncbi:MAG: hypothetical protein HY015_04205, partial [Bacteroidetes bacterium]|nr:hypothetical protein [Bacteroidota bacterium]
MINNKERLYWVLQIGGWSFYASFQVIANVLASGSGSINGPRTVFFFYEALLCLLASHFYRYYINRWRWFSLGMARLILRVIMTVCVMGLVMYFLRIPVSLPLGLFNSNMALDLMRIFGQSLFYAILFFLWSALYFIYNY